MFQDFKPVLKILLRFLLIYLLLLFCYQYYLNGFEGKELDRFSYGVAENVAYLMNAIGYETRLNHLPEYETVQFIVNGKTPTRMVEGCNAISVMILFIAFVLAFYNGTKTILFTISGLVILHLMNVVRIAGLTIVILDYPKYGKIAHDYFFPAIIYGSVVLLWLVWIKFFALRNNESQ